MHAKELKAESEQLMEHHLRREELEENCSSRISGLRLV
jgi:hypothetical protein